MSLLSRFRKGSQAPKGAGIEALKARYPHTALSDCEERLRTQVVGQVISVTEPGTHSCFTAVIEDGSGTLRLTWPGRAEVPGVVTGAYVVARGTIGCRDDELRILGPEYSIEVPS